MRNSELQALLQRYPNDMDIKLLPVHAWNSKPIAFSEGNVLHTSETAYIDSTAPEDEWDTDEGKVRLGEGKQYLLINPIIQ